MTEVIDYQLALEQAAGDEGLAKELFEMLLNELPILKEKLGRAIKASDLQGCWDHAHKIYGSTAYCGVPALRTAAQAMESVVKGEDMGQIEGNFTALSTAIERLLEQGRQALITTWDR